MQYVLRKSFVFIWIACLSVVSLFTLPIPVLAADAGSLRGTIRDPLGAVVAGATVELLRGTVVVKTATTDAAGNYFFDTPLPARYRIRAGASSFQRTVSTSVYITKSMKAELDITLSTPTFTQQV